MPPDEVGDDITAVGRSPVLQKCPTIFSPQPWSSAMKSITETLQNCEVATPCDPLTIGNKLPEDQPGFINECHQHDLHCCALNGRFGRSVFTPLQPFHRRSLAAWIPTKHPGFVLCDHSFNRISPGTEHCKASAATVHSSGSLWGSDEMWNPLCRLLCHLQVSLDCLLHTSKGQIHLPGQLPQGCFAVSPEHLADLSQFCRSSFARRTRLCIVLDVDTPILEPPKPPLDR